ncbi:pyridoxal-phosphate dependent enzyme [Maribacter ulvicola]|uniref:Threonine dehydratase n=1 Tax=Maribacter ulvicola TaxID=228959 RepID=A0A1N6NVJ8_9FLAO|nr:pyridoxal-phosphate dependent enzyme [Maribacter ulvicola]SIP96119.1 threonine dehydratase [Maribacter ulvicola]
MTKQELLDCHQRIIPFVHNTAVLTSRSIDKEVNAQVFFKCENFQRAGAYKIRGAANAILQLSEEEKKRGVVTHSSGNFAQALSLAAQSLGVTAHIVMPNTAPEVKKAGVREYGGIIYECKPTVEARQSLADEIGVKTGATFVHPSNDNNVILGQGTAALELLEKQPDLDFIFCPVGGGGLIAGTALAAKYFADTCKVYGAEPYEVDDAYRSLVSDKIERNETTNTIADGLKTMLGDKNFPIIRALVSGIVRVTEDEIIAAMKLVWERMKIIIEPSSSVTVAAVLKQVKEQPEGFQNKKIGVIISGGNVDLSKLPF